MVSEASTVLRTSICISRPGKAADLSTEEKRKQSIAAVWRGFYSRWEGPAAETIQKWWRGYVARRFIQALRQGRLFKHGTREYVEVTAAVVIQRHWRGFLSRRKTAELLKAVLDIQRWWKGYRARKEWPRLRLRWRARNYYAIDIQRWVRGHLARRRVWELLHQHHQRCQPTATAADEVGQDLRQAAATAIQAYWRRHQAQKRCSWLKREEVKRKRYQMRLAAANVIQSYYRGWFVRHAVARLCAKGPLMPGSLAGGVVAAPGIAGDVRNAVVLPYGEYDGDDAAEAQQQRERSVLPPHGHPTPPPLPRATATPAAPRAHMIGGAIAGGNKGTDRSVRGRPRGRAPLNTAVATAPLGPSARASPVTSKTTTTTVTATATALDAELDLRQPSQPQACPPPQQPGMASQVASSVMAQAAGRRAVNNAGTVVTPTGSALASIRAVRAAAAAAPSVSTSGSPTVAIVTTSPVPAAVAAIRDIRERQQQQQQQQHRPEQQICVGELRQQQQKRNYMGPIPSSPPSPLGPLRKPPSQAGKPEPPLSPLHDKPTAATVSSPPPLRVGGMRTAPAANSPQSPPSPLLPPSPVTPTLLGPLLHCSPVAGSSGGSATTAAPVAPAPSPGKPSTAPSPLTRVYPIPHSVHRSVASTSATTSTPSRSLEGRRFGAPSADQGCSGDSGGGTDAAPKILLLAAAGNGSGSPLSLSQSQSFHRVGTPTSLSLLRTPSMPAPLANRSDPLRTSKPLPRRPSVSAGGGASGGGRNNGRKEALAAAAQTALRRQAWDSDGMVGAAAASMSTATAAAVAAVSAVSLTPSRASGLVAVEAAVTHDAASNPLHDQIMRVNRGDRDMNGAVTPRAVTAAAMQRRKTSLR